MTQTNEPIISDEVAKECFNVYSKGTHGYAPKDMRAALLHFLKLMHIEPTTPPGEEELAKAIRGHVLEMSVARPWEELSHVCRAVYLHAARYVLSIWPKWQVVKPIPQRPGIADDNDGVAVDKPCQKCGSTSIGYSQNGAETVFYCTDCSHVQGSFEKRIKELESEVNKWKANHDEMVARNKLLRDRTDLSADQIAEREKWPEKIKALEAELSQLRTRGRARMVHECQPGDKLRFDPKYGGLKNHHDEATKAGLVVGQIYTVDSTDVGSWYTDIYFVEAPKFGLNSVMFKYAELATRLDMDVLTKEEREDLAVARDVADLQMMTVIQAEAVAGAILALRRLAPPPKPPRTPEQVKVEFLAAKDDADILRLAKEMRELEKSKPNT